MLIARAGNAFNLAGRALEGSGGGAERPRLCPRGPRPVKQAHWTLCSAVPGSLRRLGRPATSRASGRRSNFAASGSEPRPLPSGLALGCSVHQPGETTGLRRPGCCA